MSATAELSPRTSGAKILSFDELVEFLDERRAGKTVVHCHGVFDLLHVGHIRHFEEARRLGDLLVVTVTPDRFVNKGPDRPVFSQDLRAEAIAALGCVDLVAVNGWPTAVETIRRIRPDFFAKGSEYREAAKDRTGGIAVEEEAVRSAGGRLVFTEDAAFSSSHLINRHHPALPEEAREWLTRFSERRRPEEVIGWLEESRPLRVLCVGEAIVDEYQWCEAIGKSSKDPMLSVRRASTERFPGGILAVANHLAALHDRVGVATFLGEVDPQEELIRGGLRPGIEPLFLRQRGAPTIVKRRMIESYYSTKLLEVYELSESFDAEDAAALVEALDRLVPLFDAVAVADYGHGMLTDDAIGVLCRRAKFLAVNAQSSAGNYGYHTVSKYPRADYVCIAENEIRAETRLRRNDLPEMVREVSRKLDCRRVVVTRGSRGCLAFDRDEGLVEVPAVATRVVDRMGVGECFFAVTVPCMVRGAPLEVVGLIGNAAGARAVATVGNRTSLERVPLFRHIECLMK